MGNKISIVEYKATDKAELLRLLLELHKTYFSERAAKQIQELNEEKNIEKSYVDYINLINADKGDTWKILFAVAGIKKIGFIIGSVDTDEYLLKGAIGKFEDWYVEEQYRGSGVGIHLYNELEKWFKQRGCQQVMSDTWHGNELSIKAHKKLGFFITGVSFGKIIE